MFSRMPLSRVYPPSMVRDVIDTTTHRSGNLSASG